MSATLCQPQNSLSRIPAELRERPQWVLWRYATRYGTLTKVPCQVNGRPAKSNDPATWTTFDEAAERYEQGGFAGLGYMFAADDPYVGIDLDGCRDPETGITEPWAREWLERFASYAEISPSLTGWKVWMRGVNPKGKGGSTRLDGAPVCGKQPGVEIYDRGRYFAATGLCEDHTEIREAGGELGEFVRVYWPR